MSPTTERVLFRDLNTAELREQFRSAQPFPSIVIDDFLDADFARAMARSYPDFEVARELGFEFNAVNEKRKVQVTDEARFPDPVKQFAQLAASPEFRKLLSEISGIDDLLWDDTYAGAGMHLTASSGRLDVHVDFNRLESTGWHRRLNLLLFLNERWEDEWGGKLELWDKDVTQCAHSLKPIFNRLVLFETSEISFHGVTPIKCPPDTARKSFALYYYSEQAPPGVAPDKVHSTVFRARPEEYVRGHVLMPLSRARETLLTAFRSAKSRTARLLGLRRA